MNKFIIPALIVAAALMASPALAESTSSSTEGYTCLKTAVKAREASMKVAATDFGTALAAAFSEREVALSAAYDASNTRKEAKDAIRAAWAEFKKDLREVRSEFKSDKKAVWTTFKSAAKACKANDISDVSSERADATI
jgi:hypothetical protein